MVDNESITDSTAGISQLLSCTTKAGHRDQVELRKKSSVHWRVSSPTMVDASVHTLTVSSAPNDISTIVGVSTTNKGTKSTQSQHHSTSTYTSNTTAASLSLLLLV